MFLIREVFNCKPGSAKQLVEKFKKAIPVMEREDGFKNIKIMVDYAAPYWTVVLESEVETLDMFDEHMRTYGSRPEFQDAMKGYMELITGGYREIYRLM